MRTSAGRRLERRKRSEGKRKRGAGPWPTGRRGRADARDRVEYGPKAQAAIDSPTIADRKQIARDSYAAFAAGDRSFFEEHLSDDLRFSAPPDPELDRDGYFERCWPGAGRHHDFDFVRVIEAGDEVIVTYESTITAGGRGRNTEVLTFDEQDKIARIEVYFGWNLE